MTTAAKEAEKVESDKKGKIEKKSDF